MTNWWWKPEKTAWRRRAGWGRGVEEHGLRQMSLSPCPLLSISVLCLHFLFSLSSLLPPPLASARGTEGREEPADLP